MANCHKMVRDTAQGIAAAMYEELALDNVWYKLNPSQKHFVNWMWPKLLQEARSTLAGMLNGPYSDELKEAISEALLLDTEIRHGRPRQMIRT